MNLEEYSQYRETLLHEQPGFAYNTYLCTIPQDFARVDLHWHDQMEIIYVKKGRGTVTAASRKYPVMAGSIMPILPGELHAIDGDPGVRMEYENIIFPLSLLDNQVENDWARRNILTPLQMGTCASPARSTRTPRCTPRYPLPLTRLTMPAARGLTAILFWCAAACFVFSLRSTPIGSARKAYRRPPTRTPSSRSCSTSRITFRSRSR